MSVVVVRERLEHLFFILVAVVTSAGLTGFDDLVSLLNLIKRKTVSQEYLSVKLQGLRDVQSFILRNLQALVIGQWSLVHS